MEGRRFVNGNNRIFKAVYREIFQYRYSSNLFGWHEAGTRLDIDTADDNNFYADNVVAETETSQFTSGSVTTTVDGLEPAAATLALGLPETQNVEVDSKQVGFQPYGAGMEPPYLGFGCVRRTMMNGKTQYWPFILPKIRYSIPSEEMATQEENIDWQTQELSATVLRDDTEAQNWKYLSAAGMDTEAEAEEAVKAFLKITV